MNFSKKNQANILSNNLDQAPKTGLNYKNVLEKEIAGEVKNAFDQYESSEHKTDSDMRFIEKYKNNQKVYLDKINFCRGYREIDGLKIPRSGVLHAKDLKNIPDLTIYPAHLIFFDEYEVGKELSKIGGRSELIKNTDSESISDENVVRWIEEKGWKVRRYPSKKDLQNITDQDLQQRGRTVKVFVDNKQVGDNLTIYKELFENEENRRNKEFKGIIPIPGYTAQEITCELKGVIKSGFDGVSFDTNPHRGKDTRFFMQALPKIQKASDDGLVNFRIPEDNDWEKINEICPYPIFWNDLILESGEGLDRNFSSIHSSHSGLVTWSNSDNDGEGSCIHIEHNPWKNTYTGDRKSGYIHNLARGKERTLLATLLPILK